MSNEEFEKWAEDNGMSLSPSAFRIGTFSNQGTEMAFRAWQARQPEIDALNAEVERLRQKIDAPSFFLLGLSGAPSVPTVFRQAALMHHESLDAAMKEKK